MRADARPAATRKLSPNFFSCLRHPNFSSVSDLDGHAIVIAADFLIFRTRLCVGFVKLRMSYWSCACAAGGRTETMDEHRNGMTVTSDLASHMSRMDPVMSAILFPSPCAEYTAKISACSALIRSLRRRTCVSELCRSCKRETIEIDEPTNRQWYG